jgi:hypothetical protein
MYCTYNHRYRRVPQQHRVYTIQGTTINVRVEGNFRGPFLKYHSHNDPPCLLSMNTSQNRGFSKGVQISYTLTARLVRINYIQYNALRHTNRSHLFECDSFIELR